MSFPRYPEYKDSGVKWLGEVPAHWDVSKMKWVAKMESGHTPDKKVQEYWENGNIPWVSLNDTGYLKDHDYISDTAYCVTELGIANSSAHLLPARAVVFSRDATIGRCAITTRPMAVSQHFIAWVCGGSMSPEYLLLVLRSMTQELDSLTTGATLKTIGMPEVRTLATPVPPLEEQVAIVGFVGRESAKIDALVAEQQRLIELLKEKRQAVISHAVTKGLNPDTPMKPSGVEWLGEVPAHWRVVPLGKVTVSRCDGPFGSGLKSEHYTDCGVRVIRLQNIRRDGFHGTDEAFIDADYYERELSGHDVVAGDVLIAGLGDDNNTVGRACVAPRGIEPAMVKADCFRVRLDRDQATPEFVATALSAGSAADAGILSSGSTLSRIPLSVMATRKLALPPVAEQEEIAAYLSAAALKFDTLITEAQRAIDLLQERRTALISAAVTGQIDVRAIPDRAAA